ncbi:hypoxanthine phosphoribosyltransferase [candidate division WWE3 bacterium CG_4_10_14_0_2_um_filter_42_7]|uniref:Hypoxanthine phosphoribosyltransferase n=3 Tax=Bacteria candidate phyla TaxID=1783234 RepID=A0A2M7QI61_9BACT|nr:MAG: hypoxanthine phosphoribosyltransferase [candidate division WWE3 bacterium CG08_land_8_20_14_0_20_41_15]PIY71982.1 MAG: hypoxanthine phosphoribosyltransferase [Candidatus Roizmanbacteria bacterium CG_4_10_14_0_8_um_filter_33_9]PIZ43770.1 MAG: hypoxanthine phosphoribosyltransferase [candidate division WWE3 bacterium CG_4_10_14_0_2_um_filter_42_7]
MKINPGKGASLLFKRAEILKTVGALGRTIDRDYKGRNPVLLVILKGAHIFAAELSLSIEIPHETEFATLSSYGDNVVSSNTLHFLMDNNIELHGRHAILIEDIVDTGLSLDYILKVLPGRNPASLATCALLNKPERRIESVEIRYVGFTIPNCYVIGHGMDFQQGWRHLPDIWAVNASWIKRNAKPPEVITYKTQ